jgi:hypothetical protein
MRQRGRKTEGQLMALAFDGSQSQLNPPSYLNEAEHNLFAEIVDAVSPTHFAKSDTLLIVSLVQATLLSRQAAGDRDQVVTWEKATRMQAMLAKRLRLTPQSRLDPKTVGRRQPYPGPRPWRIIELADPRAVQSGSCFTAERRIFLRSVGWPR